LFGKGSDRPPPINLISLGEYVLKAPWLQVRWFPRDIRPILRWIRSAPHKGRAMVMFDHPNAMASYLVLILGLGLGLILATEGRRRKAEGGRRKAEGGRRDAEGGMRKAEEQIEDLLPESSPSNSNASSLLPPSASLLSPLPPSSFLSVFRLPPSSFIYPATFLNLVGIFCSGSRNGLAIAISQILLFSLMVKASRKILLVGLFGLVGLVSLATVLGIGGRSLSFSDWANDPRLRIWQIAIDLIHERPWLGWGLGNFKFQYLPRLLDRHPECIAQQTANVIPVECADVMHPHNFWLMLGAEAGLVVFVLFTLLVGEICYRSVRTLISASLQPLERGILLGYLLAFWGCVAYSIFDVTLFDARLNITSWVILASLYTLNSISLKSLGD
jgi:O-Antigen ligase